MTDKEASAVLTKVDGSVGIITLNQPESFNAISTGIVAGVSKALAEFEADPAIRVLLLRASGKNFCTGANLKEAGVKLKDPVLWSEFIQNGLDVFRNLEKSTLPVIVEVHGLCLAGGLELMLCGDVVFAAASAKIGDQHAQFGLLPGWGGSQRLPRAIGIRRALDLMYSAKWLTAEDASDIGLVNYVEEDASLSASALKYCKTLAERSPRGMAVMKSLVRQGMELDLDEAIALETKEALEYMKGDDAKEGLAAFGERRKPAFK